MTHNMRLRNTKDDDDDDDDAGDVDQQDTLCSDLSFIYIMIII